MRGWTRWRRQACRHWTMLFHGSRRRRGDCAGAGARWALRGGWLAPRPPAGLPALDDAVPRIAAKTSGLRWRWAAVALAGALAASVALFFANSRPHPEPARAAKREAGMHKPQAPSVVYRAGPRGHPVRKRFPVHRQAPQPALDDFVPFDDADPMQMGMVVRVMLPVSDASLTGGAQEVAADLVIGEDGRARAIRLVR